MKALEAKLNQLLGMASTMTRTLSQHETSLNTHKSTFDGIANNVQTLTTKINDLGKTVSDLNHMVNVHGSNLTVHQRTVDSLKNQMAGQKARVATDETKFHNLVRNISHHQSSLDSFTRSVGRLDNSTRSLNTRVNTNTNKVNTNKHTLDSLTTRVNTQANKLSYDEKRLSNITTLVNQHTRKLSDMQHTLDTHNTKIGQQNAKLATDEKTLATLVNDVKAAKDVEENLNKAITTVAQITSDNLKKLNSEEQTMESISNQLMQQQTFVEERIRSDGMSGIKSLRHIHEGTQSYYGDTHVGGSALSAHDHADYDRTIGLGEFAAVMNGVDFRTRHNDYKFKRPTRTGVYNSVEDIPFPDVPPQVLNKKTMQEQIAEMRKWFKAFKDQDHSVRDYRKYFKPNLCYLEGGWTLNAKTISEPFESDRHHIDAQSWFELQEKIRYTSYSGGKSNLENFAYLPTMMYNYTNGIPQIAQWNYRIVCHPLKQDVPTSYFDVQDDLANRMARKYTWDRVPNTRAARYKLNEFGTDRGTYHTFLDSLMAEIPGKDNYGNNLTDNSFGLLHYDIAASAGTNKVLNVGHYHRWYKLLQKGAMGLQVNHRGFRDENMWVAMTTQPNIMPMTLKHCVGRNCEYQTKRVTYALPLEIVYSTPLQSWNPLNLNLDKESVASKNGRNGAMDAQHAYNGSSFRHYYRTPVEFYHDGALEKDAADTARGAVGVLDRDGHVKKAAPTGFRIMTPNIQDVGSIRTRYPIFPVHSEGSPLGEEVAALKKMMMQMSKYANLFESPPVGGSAATAAQTADVDVDFEVRESGKNPPGLHGHDFSLTAAEYKSVMNGTRVTVTTSYNLGHQHELEVYYNKGNQNFYIGKCDGLAHCWDGHSLWLRKP